MNWKKLEICVDDLKITVWLYKREGFYWYFFVNVLLNQVDTLPRNGKTISKSFFSAVSVIGLSVSPSLRRFLIQLSIKLIGNAFFFYFFWHTSKGNPEKSETIENIGNNKAKIKPILYCSEIKIMKFDYILLNMGLWYTIVLKPLLVLSI